MNRIRTAGVALISFFVGLASSIFALPLWIAPVLKAIGEAKPADWMGFAGNFAGNLLTGLIAAIAIYAAWKASSSQMRISLASREEDRIELILPGLQGAVDLCDSITKQNLVETNILRIRDRLREIGLQNPAATAALVNDSASGIPDHLKRRLITDITRLCRRASSASDAWLEYKNATDIAALDETDAEPRFQIEFDRRMTVFRQCNSDLIATTRVLKRELRECQRLLPILRSEIRSYIV